MNTVSDLGLDLEKLFQPAWAQGKTEANRFEKFTGNEGVKPERSFSGKPGERRGPRREGGGGFGGGGERRGAGGPPRGGSKFGDRKRGFGGRRDDRRETERREPPAPLPEIAVTFLPDENGVESLARQIKMTGRAYPLFDIARLILQKPERYAVKLDVKKIVAPASSPARSEATHGQDARAASTVAQPLFVCALDETPWLSEDEAVAHVLKTHFATFYLAERTAVEPPKGRYTFVAQCGVSGVILGPPNHHDYQNQLRKLHAERFSRMPFDMFKSRVKIVKDEAVVKKWVEEQSFKTEYTVLNVPEPLKLPSIEEVEKHFRADPQGHHHQVRRVAHGRRGAEPQSALPRIAAARAERLGAAGLFSAATGDEIEPRVCRARPPVFQGQQDRHARRRRAPAIFGP